MTLFGAGEMVPQLQVLVLPEDTASFPGTLGAAYSHVLLQLLEARHLLLIFTGIGHAYGACAYMQAKHLHT